MKMEELRILEIRERLRGAAPGATVTIPASSLRLILDWTDAMLQTNTDLVDWVSVQTEEALESSGFGAIWERSAERLLKIVHGPDYVEDRR